MRRHESCLEVSYRGGQGSIIYRLQEEATENLSLCPKSLEGDCNFKYGNDRMWFMFQMHALTDEWKIDWGGEQEYNKRGKFRRPLP